MTVTVREVLKADLVLVGVELLKSATEIQQFRSSIEVTVHVGSGTATDAATGTTLPATAVALQRERITISSLPDRTTVVKEFPSLDDPGPDWRRFAQVATLAYEATDDVSKNPRAFGYNFKFVFDIDSEQNAPNFLAQRMLSQRPLGNQEWELIGGAVLLMFGHGSRRWTFSLQPQPEGDPSAKILALDVNLHVEEPRAPDENEIRDALNEIWAEVHTFMARLGEVESM